jgi:arginine deiminase
LPKFVAFWEKELKRKALLAVFQTPWRGVEKTRGEMNVTSEIGRLRQVLVYNGVDALEVVYPGEVHELLLEDTLDPELVAEEHALFTACLRRIAGRDGVLDLRTLLVESAGIEESRVHFSALVPGNRLPKSLPAEDLVKVLLTGMLGKKRLAAPIPNFMFTRDLGAVVGDTMFLANSGQFARMREPALLEGVLRYHPKYQVVASKLVKSGGALTLEGGDVLVLDKETVVVGQGERTCRDSITPHLGDFRQAGIRQVLVVVMPPARWNMHLDTVFTQIDTGDYLVYKPLIDPRSGRHGVDVIAYHLDEGGGGFETKYHRSLRAALDFYRIPVDRLIPCAGKNATSLAASQEQWSDACNSLALRPGLVIVYRHNRRTNEALAKAGYAIVDAEKFKDPRFPIPNGKTAVTLPGNEIGHGRGGPHCLTQPWIRDPV